MDRLSNEDKILRIRAMDAISKKGFPIKQEVPCCKFCHTRVNIMDPAVRVEFPRVILGGKTFVLAAPICPKCHEKIPPETSITH